MTTFSHQYLATWFYSNEAIQESLNRNRIEQVTGSTDESLINIINYNQIHITSYKNDYERQILEKKKIIMTIKFYPLMEEKIITDTWQLYMIHLELK